MKAMPVSFSSSVDIDAADTKKRSRDLGNDEGYLSPEDLLKLSRSERKKHREKKRRSHVSKGFDDLMNLLIEIDPSVRIEAEERARRGQWKGSIGAQEDNALTRVDLITRTVDVLRRVHRENEERKVIVMELTRGGSGVGLGGRTAVVDDEVRKRETVEHMGKGLAFTHNVICSPFITICQITRMFPMTMCNPSTESLTHRALEHSTLFQQGGLGQATMADSGAAAAALLGQRSLTPFGVGSASAPPGGFLGLQGLGSIPELLLSSIMAERNRAAMGQTYLPLLQDEAANAAAASQFRSGVQMGFTGLPRQLEKSGPGLPNGRRF
jgi:hypothetical protein